MSDSNQYGSHSLVNPQRARIKIVVFSESECQTGLGKQGKRQKAKAKVGTVNRTPVFDWSNT